MKLVVCYNFIFHNLFMSQVEAIRRAARLMVRELHLLDGRLCIAGFSFSECHLITELQRLGQASASDLGELLVLEKSTVSRLVNGLLRKGMLETRVDLSDRRRRWLRLTSAGQLGADRVHLYARAQVAAALDYVADGELPNVIDGLDRYARALRYARLATGVQTRPIRRDDNPAVAGIIREVMTAYGAVGEGYSIEDPEVDDMHGAYAGARAAFWVVEKEGRVLGCGGFGPLAGGPENTCELRKMYFLPELRGLGLGSRLLKICLAAAREAGFERCYLETLDSMKEARQLYRKHGFQPLTAPLGCTGHSGCNTWMARDL